MAPKLKAFLSWRWLIYSVSVQSVPPEFVFVLAAGKPFGRGSGKDPAPGEIRTVEDIRFRQRQVPVFRDDRADLAWKIETDPDEAFQKIVNAEQGTAVAVDTASPEFLPAIFSGDENAVVPRAPDDETFACHLFRIDPQFAQFRMVSDIDRSFALDLRGSDLDFFAEGRRE